MRRLLPPLLALSLAEGFAVGTLVHGGILLMGTHQNTVQRAVVLSVAMVSTGLHGALDALVGMIVHFAFLLFSDCKAILRKFRKSIHKVAI